jgi:aminopeptidase YwaD
MPGYLIFPTFFLSLASYICCPLNKKRMKRLVYIISALLITSSAIAQECFEVSKDQILSIKQDVEFLSSDALEGRSPGTAGAILARDYIAKRFSKMGVIPMGQSGFFQEFSVPEPVVVDADGTSASIGKESLALNSQFYPLLYSNNAKATGKTVWVNFGITAPELDYNDYKKVASLTGKIAVMDVSSPDGIHPHSAYAKYHDLANRISLAKEKGAIGVVMVNLGDMANDPEDEYRKIRGLGIPVIFVKDDGLAKKLKKSKDVSFAVQQEEKDADAYNVIGFIDNGKPTTVVIGAHYDHLGWGDNGSLYVGEPSIHNGADDNASGTAALIALAETLSKKKEFTGHNYLFIAFTAEERGLLGSNYYVNNPTFPIEKMAYMINMDMVGRLRENQLQISGTGTAMQWQSVFEKMECYDLKYKLDPSGVGPSDHTSFYNMGIPVLHFFTGSHSDYHKPTDDADKINYKGIATVIAVIETVMQQVNGDERLEYLETKNESARNAPKFSVTLGIMPDYMYEEGGVKVDGVTEGKPAAEAGIMKGDIIMQLGDFTIGDIYAYMGALAAFKKGDKVMVVYMREGKKMETNLQF